MQLLGDAYHQENAGFPVFTVDILLVVTTPHATHDMGNYSRRSGMY